MKKITKKIIKAKRKKEELLTEDEIQKADNFIKGSYWNGEKGCAVGCFVDKAGYRCCVPGCPTRNADTDPRIKADLCATAYKETPKATKACGCSVTQGGWTCPHGNYIVAGETARV